MSCKFCEYKSNLSSSVTNKTDEGDTYCVGYDAPSDSFSMFVWDEWFPQKSSMLKVSGVKYCPFCGDKLKAPNKELVESQIRWNKERDERRKELEKEKKKKERERLKWLEREYEKNPYDPTKPRLKNKDFRNAVKYLAKYMHIEEFYWDDELRSLTGWEGGYIDTKDGSIGPCYETNGVMESFHDSGRTYSVKELCYGFKKEKEEK